MDKTIPFNQNANVVIGPGGAALQPIQRMPQGISTTPTAPTTSTTPKSTPSVITSSAAVDATKRNVAELDTTNMESALRTARENLVKAGYTIGPDGKIVFNEQKTDPLLGKVDELIKTAEPKPTDPNAPKLPTKTPEQIEAETEMKNIRSSMDSLQAQMDSRAASIIEGIKKEYDGLIQEQETANRAYEGGLTTEGIVSGRARYAPTIQMGILNSAIQSGIAAISKLQAKKQSLILEAENARDEKKFKVLNEKMNMYRETVKEERAEAQRLFENTINLSQEARAKAKEDRDRIKDERIEAEAMAENLAPSLASILGEDEEENLKIIDEMARERSIDPNLLIGAVNNYIAKSQAESRKNLPALVQEFEYARNNGFFDGSFLEYQRVRGEANRRPPQSKVLSLKNAVRMNLPFLAGIAEDELIMDLIQDTWPDWFLQYIDQSPRDWTEEEVTAEWERIKNDPEVVAFTRGEKKSSASEWESILERLERLNTNE